MLKSALLLSTLCFIALPSTSLAQRERPRFMLVVHGGAGTILREDMTAERERQYRETLTTAIRAGYDVLNGGGRSLEAVVAVITRLEDSPLFNAGKGSVFTNAGTNELDAAIMDGRTGNAGSIAGVTHIRNPIVLARLVMDGELVQHSGCRQPVFVQLRGKLDVVSRHRSS